jgi:hypothetical protein
MIEQKTCSKCKNKKPYEAFFVNKKCKADGRASACKECAKNRTFGPIPQFEIQIDLINEIWNDVPGYEGLYEVSDQGRIRSCDLNTITKYGKAYTRKGKINKAVFSKGYLKIRLSKENKPNNFYVHRLVAKAFIPNPYNLPEVNHKKGIKWDNRASELEWSSKSENTLHSYVSLERERHFKGRFGKDHHSSKKINQLDLNGNFIKTWDSMKEIQRAGIAFASNIGRCCGGFQRTVKGFKWQYA